MKKTIVFLGVISINLLSLVSCSKTKSAAQTTAATLTASETKHKEHSSIQLSTDSSNLVDYDSIKKFFTLDFTPEYPDSDIAASKENTKKSNVKR